MASNGINGAVEALKTRVLPVKSSVSELGQFSDSSTLSQWVLPALVPQALEEAARHIRTTAIPVAFPTETVYGLGADATRSDAVKGIYAAKGRPSDNPLIIHVSDLTMLRSLIAPGLSPAELNDEKKDPIPEIYHTVIKRFWPGPLTILLPNPENSKLAPEVTAGLKTFGARMPKTSLALSLISLAGVPVAAPSANASTKPSPTTAEHVLHDLNDRIEIILDGGPCAVGVESTVVDGLCSPPVVLRPGGVSLDDIRGCKGWEGCVKAYKDASEVESNGIAPRAPGMKYKHYSPRAKVMLFEASCPDMLMQTEVLQEMAVAMAVVGQSVGKNKENNTAEHKVGIIRTKRSCDFDRLLSVDNRSVASSPTEYPVQEGTFRQGPVIKGKTFQISLGEDTKVIAHGLFSALRDLDQRNVDVIFVEGISDEGDIAAAIMNRLRKAASVIHR